MGKQISIVVRGVQGALANVFTRIAEKVSIPVSFTKSTLTQTVTDGVMPKVGIAIVTSSLNTLTAALSLPLQLPPSFSFLVEVRCFLSGCRFFTVAFV